ncbi:hypothetical protein VTJ49DRAFT_1082 [Mycothermus thermophilus]|uniref:SPT2 chromatin protein n=1 Tax=Humicola insolens TaxID=85995 RepID=A0ABR3VFF4_HUMIN
MAILDLLASITGEKPSPSPTAPASRPTPSLGKRKAEDDLRPAASKAPRGGEGVTKASPSSNGNSLKPAPRPTDRPADRPSGNVTKPSSTAASNVNDKKPPVSKPVLDKRKPDEKPAPTVVRSRPTGTTASSGDKTSLAKPNPSRPSPTESGPPKKRSFAEIMARAKANSERREALVKIQHKTVEKTLTPKERKELALEEAKKAKLEAKKNAATARVGGTSSSIRDAAKARDGAKPLTARAGGASGSSTAKKGPEPPAEPKKLKKAALATTGYTGTARPRATPPSASKPGAPSRSGGDARARERPPRYGGPLSRRPKRYEEEEDDDLDDFIVDDEEEEEAGYGVAKRYEYYSDEDDSDMEAGISDIEEEETRAERQARLEDMEQEALERRLKAEKEERKRRLLEAARARSGR